MLALGNKLSLPTIKVSKPAIAQYGDLALHYDISGSRTTSNDYDDGDEIALLHNYGSAGGNTMSNDHNARATVGQQGLWQKPQASTMGKPSVKLDGSNDFYVLDNNYVTSTGDFTVAVSFRIHTVNGDAVISGDTGGLNRVHVYANSLLLRFNGNGSTNAGIQIFHNNTDNSTVSYSIGTDIEVLVIRMDSSNNIYVYNKDGDFISYYPADTKTDQPLQIGTIGMQLPSASAYGGWIGEIGVYTTDIGETAAKAVAQALYAKWS